MARLVKLSATGPVKVEPSDKPVFVCACGLSKRFPFCDGTHKTCRDEAEGQTFVYDEHGQRHPAPKA
jgi:CDGSH-type Zn-finger protein